MPEYLAPGVYVEEVSFRSKSIEGVPTSTTGFAGMTRFGPLRYAGGPSSCEPRLVTSFTEFERVYGGLTPLSLDTDGDGAADSDWLPYLAHAARAFFDNGGKRLYVSRVFVARSGDAALGVANRAVTVAPGRSATWRARWPGADGNAYVETRLVRSKNVAFADDAHAGAVQARRAKAGSVVEIYTPPLPAPPPPPALPPFLGNAPLDPSATYVVTVDAAGLQHFFRSSDGGELTPGATDVIQIVEMQVIVKVDAETVYVFDQLAADPAQKRDVARILQRDDPEDENAPVWLEWDPTGLDEAAAKLMKALHDNPGRLDGGNDGAIVGPDDLRGEEADPDDATKKATGLEALGDIDDIAIVALPDGGALGGTSAEQAADRLIGHAERLRYRIAVVDAPEGSSMNEIRAFRGKFDSKYAALYHPWIEIFDPTERAAQGAPPKRLLLPPSGFVCGIYARSDIERGVHKAPANEVVRGLTRFEANINKGRQDVLNPEGINALRFFEGRGNRVWGARTISSDPEWKYVNVRRLFIYLEHSIDKGTQWAVFEPNNDRLWANIRQTVEDFLLVLWKNGALLGQKPEDAYFVRCDRTTMTQNDIDNGRMICLIGVAPVKPAEFVIFRVGQWTAGAKVN